MIDFYKIIKKGLVLLSIIGLSNQLIAANYYWVNNSGNWSDYSNHWATSSGGSTFHSSVPGPLDNAIFDENSLSIDGEDITYDSPLTLIGNFDASLVERPMSFSGLSSNEIRIYGDWKLSANVNYLFTGQTVLKSTSVTSIDVKTEVNASYLTIDSELGQFHLNNNYKGDLLKLSSGSFDLQGYDLKLNGGRVVGGNMDISSSNFILTDGGEFIQEGVGSFSLMSSGSSVTLGLASIFALNDVLLNNVVCNSCNLGGSNWYIDTLLLKGTNLYLATLNGNYNYVHLEASGILNLKSDNLFNKFLIESGATIIFEKQSIQTIKESIEILDTMSTTFFKSNSLGEQGVLNLLGADACFRKLFVEDIAITGTANAYAGAGSFDLGNNSGWTFSQGSCNQITPTCISPTYANLSSSQIHVCSPSTQELWVDSDAPVGYVYTWYKGSDIVQGPHFNVDSMLVFESGEYSVLLTDTNQPYEQCFIYSDTLTVFIDPCTNINSSLNSSIKVYPNPSDGNFGVFSYEDEIKRVELIDMFGNSRMVVNAQFQKIETEALKNGYYILIIYMENGIIYRRMVIN